MATSGPAKGPWTASAPASLSSTPDSPSLPRLMRLGEGASALMPGEGGVPSTALCPSVSLRETEISGASLLFASLGTKTWTAARLPLCTPRAHGPAGDGDRLWTTGCPLTPSLDSRGTLSPTHSSATGGTAASKSQEVSSTWDVARCPQRATSQLTWMRADTRPGRNWSAGHRRALGRRTAR